MVKKVQKVTSGMFSSSPSQRNLDKVNSLDPGGIRIIKGPPESINTDDNVFDPDDYTDEEIEILVDYGKVPRTAIHNNGGYFTTREPNTSIHRYGGHNEEVYPGDSTTEPYLGGIKPVHPITIGTITNVLPTVPPEVILATNKAVGAGLTESIKKNPNNTVAIMIYLSNPSWIIENMPGLPKALVHNIKLGNDALKIITRDLLEHMDLIYPTWYKKVTNPVNAPFVGLKDYYEASDIYMPDGKCLSDRIELTGAQKLKLLTGFRHPKTRKHKYPIIGASL